MRAFDPEVHNTVWAAIEPLIPVPVDNHPLGCHCRRSDERLRPGHRTRPARCRGRRVIAQKPCWWGGNRQESDGSGQARMEVVAAHRPPWNTAWLDDRRGEPQRLDHARTDTGQRRRTRAARRCRDHLARPRLRLQRHPSASRRPQPRRRSHRQETPDGIDQAPKKNLPMGLRWPVERTNSWLSNFGRLRRNTDRKPEHRLAQLALAVAFLLTAKLIDWRNRWSPHLSPIR